MGTIKRIPRFGDPKELLKAAEILRPHFTAADGRFAWKLFRQYVGSHISTKRGYEGSEGIVKQNSKGEFYIHNIDTEKRGRINPERDRQEAAKGSVQLEYLASNWSPVYDDNGNLLFEGGPQLLKEWRKYKSTSKTASKKIVDAEKAVSNFNIEFGHLRPLKGKDSQTPEGSYDASAIPEYREAFVVPDGKGGLKFNLGNNPKSNDPAHHLDKEEMNLSGGHLPGTEQEAFTRFILKKSGYEGSITGVNLGDDPQKSLTIGDYKTAAFQHKRLQQIAAERDRLLQLQQQGVSFKPHPGYTAIRENVDPETGLKIGRRPDIFARPKGMFSGTGLDPSASDPTSGPQFTTQGQEVGSAAILSQENQGLSNLQNLAQIGFDAAVEDNPYTAPIKWGIELGQAAKDKDAFKALNTLTKIKSESLTPFDYPTNPRTKQKRIDNIHDAFQEKNSRILPASINN